MRFVMKRTSGIFGISLRLPVRIKIISEKSNLEVGKIRLALLRRKSEEEEVFCTMPDLKSRRESITR